ncbi:KpsF/GutQ family sugar-phosphate isomerase [Flavobacterium sp. xlx-214]|uniref:KpsF/GutQ family sugar-phosphate isomerase n=1 Tax=unclassified Flavobacterium TaxID=196869 RepID=UPI0013D71C47|nr:MULTISPECIES: KpsF/GutQ family sugar-phosphate isomerase [unclassified Flavobacterium]MBA5791237.1 KpsF/GutQ family sugar-phosphate isomerase [Flavobacterium sp. xlx-221]QMI83597.1 KpsF/GutQ family sugar-phosphate isomerase [Flavobacterium sp. xlx-214]
MTTNFNILTSAKETLKAESEAILHAMSNLTEDFTKAVESIFNTNGRLIVTGIGKSAHIGQKIVATLNSTGTPSMFMHASEAVHGDLGMITKNDIILCISKSGNSPEIKVLAPLLKRDGNILIGMTGNAKSFLGKTSDFIINADVTKEADPNNLAPTTSTTVQLALGDALAVALIEMRNFTAQDFAKFHPGGALGKKLLLKIADILDKNNTPSVHLSSSIQEVIFEISNKRLGVTAVIENNQVKGIITDGDIRRMLEKTADLSNITATDLMSKNPKTIDIHSKVEDALNLMESFSITQLVVTENGLYTGIIHLHDILKEGIVS